MNLTIGAETKSVDRFAIVFDLKLYLAVRTKETILDSDEVYTQRAKAAWSFDGSGTVVAGVWTKTGTGNTGAASFTAVTDGSVVPLSTAPVANTQLAGETWTTVNR